MIRCSRCRLVQYQTPQNRCRRCYQPLVVPVVAPPPEPETPQRPNVAAGVKAWRRMRGLTQKQLACSSSLPRTYISRIENGRIIPGLLTLERVAIALQVSLPILLRPITNGHKPNGNGNGHANGNGNGYSLNGNGNGNGNGNHAPFTAESENCLREILRYSGMLTGIQRMQVLARVRELTAPRVGASH